jgi:hypothetical protein
MSNFESEGLPSEEQLTPQERRRQAIERNKAELARRKEAGELDELDYEIYQLGYLQELGQPLTRKDLGRQALVLTQEGLKTLGYLDILRPDGNILTIDPEVTGYEPDDLHIIFPEELGNPQK